MDNTYLYITSGFNLKHFSLLIKLQGNGYNPSPSNVDVEDYHPIDPVPSSKASIKPGPIEHGSPLIPYIPKPSPPDVPGHPTSDGSN